MANSDAIYTWKTYRTLDGQPTGVSLKTTPGQVGGWYLSNQAASPRYVKLYDLATVPNLGSTPKVTITLPAGAVVSLLGVAGIDFAIGLGIRVTTGLADNDNTALTTNDVIVNLFYS